MTQRTEEPIHLLSRAYNPHQDYLMTQRRKLRHKLFMGHIFLIGQIMNLAFHLKLGKDPDLRIKVLQSGLGKVIVN